MTTHYVRNEIGAVHSVDEDHFNEYLHDTTRSGRRILRPEFEEIDEVTARRENPQLFGHPDPDVIHSMTSSEIKEARERREFEKQLREELLAELETAAEDETAADEAAPSKRSR